MSAADDVEHTLTAWEQELLEIAGEILAQELQGKPPLTEDEKSAVDSGIWIGHLATLELLRRKGFSPPTA